MSETVEIRTVSTDGFQMDYFTFNHGKKPMVILPGVSVRPVTGSASAVAAQYRALTAEHTVTLFDRKHGIEPGYDVRRMADDTAAAMKALGIEGADVYGTSQGGMIAQILAIRYPELVGRLVLASSLSRQNAVSRQTFSDWCRLAAGEDIRALNRHITERVYSPAYRERYARAFEALETVGTEADRRRFEVLAWACGEFDCYDELDQIRCPVMLIGSRQDRVLTGEASEEIAARLDCPVYIYEGYSHAVYDEAPDCLARVMDFFAG